MSASASGSVSSSSSSIDPNDVELLSKYVTTLSKRGEGGSGNSKYKCTLCNLEFQGSYSRVKSHLLLLKGSGVRACNTVKSKPDLLSEIRKVIEEDENRKRMAKPKTIPLPQPSSSSQDQTRFRLERLEPTRKRKTYDNSPLEKSLNQGAREHLHSLIARMFYSAGLPFHLARNPYFVEAFQYAAERQITGYVPPSYNLWRTTLLHKERTNIERLLEPLKKSWSDKGVSIAADGWTDAQRRPLLNIMAASDGGAIFLKAINCEGEFKDKHYITTLLSEAINEVGSQNVIQVITDNAPVCSAAGAIIEGMYPTIFWTPCVVHTLNLALKNICAAKVVGNAAYAYDECHWISVVIDDVMFVNHSLDEPHIESTLFEDDNEDLSRV